MTKPGTSVSVEAVSTENEKEVVLYARIGNYEGLKQAAQIIGQEQAQIKAYRGSVRVRKNTVGEGAAPVYEMTAKTPVSHDGLTKQMAEETTPINEDIFNVFMRGCDQKFVKTRYVFPIEKATIRASGMDAEVVLEGLKFEVDVFTTAAGKPSTWCKIDVEVQDLIPQLEAKGLTIKDIDLRLKASSLPFEPQVCFVDNGEKSGPLRELVTTIYETEFITPIN